MNTQTVKGEKGIAFFSSNRRHWKVILNTNQGKYEMEYPPEKSQWARECALDMIGAKYPAKRKEGK